MEITQTQHARAMNDFQEAAGNQPINSIEMIRDHLYIFTTELGMYRIADKYTNFTTKGFSKNLDSWYISIKL